MFTYSVGLWTPHTAVEHAADVMASINSVLLANNVKDSAGNQIQFVASLGNMVWLLCLALGNMRADDDLLLLAASEQFNLATESDAQLLSTLPMTGTSLIPGAYSLVTINVTADASGATVPAGTVAAYGTICNFVSAVTTVIGSGSTAAILFVSDTLGPIQVAANVLISFTSTIAHVTTITNPAAAVVGRYVETTQQLRQRLLSGNVLDTNLNGAIRAVQSIQGITQVAIYLNQSPTTNLVLQGGINIPPLRSYIVVQGSDITNLAIADAYAKRLLIDTYAVGPGPSYGPRTDVSFATADNSVNTVGGNFVTAGFAANQWLTVSGSGSNNFTFQAGSVGVSKIILGSSAGYVVLEGSGLAVTIANKNAQVYTTLSGQKIPILFDYAVNQNIWVKVFYELGTPTATGFDVTVQATVTGMQWTIGQPVTAAAILQALSAYQYARLTSAQVSLDGSSYTTEVYPNGNKVPYIPVANISVVPG